MKKAALIFAATLATGVAHADPWQWSANTLMVADWLQTRWISQHEPRYWERNPFLGKHPTTRQVDLYMAFALVRLNVIPEYLPTDWRRPWFIYYTGFEAGLVSYNNRIGIKFSTNF